MSRDDQTVQACGALEYLARRCRGLALDVYDRKEERARKSVALIASLANLEVYADEPPQSRPPMGTPIVSAIILLLDRADDLKLPLGRLVAERINEIEKSIRDRGKRPAEDTPPHPGTVGDAS